MTIGTQCLHEGYTTKMPIVQSTTCVYESTDKAAAVFDGGLIRLSVGLENVGDITARFEQGFKAI